MRRQRGGDAAGDRIEGVPNVTGSGQADVLSGDAAANRLSGGSGDDRLDGRDGDDALLGGAGDDRIAGGAGADRLEGGAGVDLLEGGLGADTLVGDASDTVSYAGSAGGVSVDLTAGTGAGADAEGDVLQGVPNLLGSGYDDSLSGNAAANTLDGSGGQRRAVGPGG